jgi:uncharacterized protein YdaT
MPWSPDQYPESMKHLPPVVREKAIEIANALLEDEGMEEGKAIRIAIARAKTWATHHSDHNPTRSASMPSGGRHVGNARRRDARGR